MNKLYEENDIQAIANAIRMKVSTKNLFPPTTTKVKGYLDTQGNIYSANTPRNEMCFNYLLVEENTTYTFTLTETTDVISAEYWFGIGAYGESKNFISMVFRGSTIPSTNNYCTFTTPSNTKYIRISGRYLEHATKVQLEKSSEPTPYEPYSKTKYKVSQMAETISNIETGDITILDVTNKDTISIEGSTLVIEEKQPRLPAEYQEVEYIETNGSQYINTNVNVNSLNLILEYEYIPIDTSINGGLFGVLDESYSLYCAQLKPSPLSFAVNYSSQGEKYTELKVTPYEKYLVKFKSGKFYINDILINSFTESSFTTRYGLGIMCMTNYGNRARHRFKSFKITQSNIITHYYIPCYRKLDDVIGVYDLITKQFLPNTGTGTFLKGDDI